MKMYSTNFRIQSTIFAGGAFFVYKPMRVSQINIVRTNTNRRVSIVKRRTVEADRVFFTGKTLHYSLQMRKSYRLLCDKQNDISDLMYLVFWA
jgi:hypothetical protein